MAVIILLCSFFYHFLSFFLTFNLHTLSLSSLLFFIFYFFFFIPLFIILYIFNFLVVSFLLSRISLLLDCNLLTVLPFPLHPKCIPFFLLLLYCLDVRLHFLIFFFICPYVNTKINIHLYPNKFCPMNFFVLHLKCKISDGYDSIFFSVNPHLLIRISHLYLFGLPIRVLLRGKHCRNSGVYSDE